MGSHLTTGEHLPEPRRNELLRRVDWRFLLRQEEEPTIVCFAEGRLARALELVAARLLRDEAEPGIADVAVLVNPGGAALRIAWSALRPGGELYAEWYRPRLRGATRVRRLLAASGFTNVRCYWPGPWPGRRSPQFWLPLDAREALEFFLRSHAKQISRRSPRVGLRALWRLAARFGVLVPVCSVARKPGGNEEGDVQERLSWLLLTGGRRSINKVVGLGFAGSTAKPQLVVKFARSPSEDEPLRREARTLRLLEETRPEVRGVPRVTFLGRRSGRVSLGESALAGRPLLPRLTRESYGGFAAQVTHWLADLAGTADPDPRDSWWGRLVEEPVQTFERMFTTVVDQEKYSRAREILSVLGDLPLVCEHRDCSPWNALIGDDGEPALVDWESSEPSGLPALDLVYFLTQAAFIVEGALESGRTRDAFSRTLDPTTFTGAVVRSCERLYSERVGLDPDVLPPLRLLCWVVHAQSDYRHLELDRAEPPNREALASSLFLGLWEEELARAARRPNER